MRILRKLLVLLLPLMLNAAGLAQAMETSVEWDVAADFSLGANPNGVWSYGYSNSLTGAFVLYSQPFDHPSAIGLQGWNTGADCPSVAHNATISPINYANITFPPGSFALHPGQSGEFSHARWTSPGDGAYTIEATFSGFDSSPTTTDVHVLIKGVSDFDGLINGYGSDSGKTYLSGPVYLKKGETVDFAVGYGSNGNYGFDTTGLAAKIKLVEWNVAADFSIASNPNGVWSYGYSSGLAGGLNLYSNTFNETNGLQAWNTGPDCPSVAYNPNAFPFYYANITFPPGSFALHPGQGGEFSHARWTSPGDGAYTIEATFSGFDSYPTSTDVHVLIKGVSVFDSLVNGYGAGSAKAYLSGPVYLKKGETVDFAVGYGSNGNYHFDTTGLAAKIKFVNSNSINNVMPWLNMLLLDGN